MVGRSYDRGGALLLRHRAWPATGPGQSSEAGTSLRQRAFGDTGVVAVGAAASRRRLELAVGATIAGWLGSAGGTRKHAQWLAHWQGPQPQHDEAMAGVWGPEAAGMHNCPAGKPSVATRSARIDSK